MKPKRVWSAAFHADGSASMSQREGEANEMRAQRAWSKKELEACAQPDANALQRLSCAPSSGVSTYMLESATHAEKCASPTDGQGEHERAAPADLARLQEGQQRGSPPLQNARQACASTSSEDDALADGPSGATPPEVPPRLRKKIRIIQPISSTWEAEAKAAQAQASAATSSEGKPSNEGGASGPSSSSRPDVPSCDNSDGHQDSMPEAWPAAITAKQVPAATMQGDTEEQLPSTVATNVRMPSGRRRGSQTHLESSLNPGTYQQSAPVKAEHAQKHVPSCSPATHTHGAGGSNTHAHKAGNSNRGSPSHAGPHEQQGLPDPSNQGQSSAHAAAGQSGSMQSGMMLGQVQGQLGLLYCWYVTNRTSYLEQAKRCLSILDQYCQGQERQQPGMEVEASELALVSQAVQTAMQIIKASADVEGSWNAKRT